MLYHTMLLSDAALRDESLKYNLHFVPENRLCLISFDKYI